ncbi:hypothetical protein INS49_005793 [Diaporthe citri]|uniref:uncharacterized protein n=1 Tax=Diaporthe citri TaxID=83186 RepID=UPI001C7E9E2F|nr:uncharacterized protein INS49_005793 [Diaporthe citri]KAG6364195.1 hypothetical protein INS49_005793 [Diaporthe citri]
MGGYAKVWLCRDLAAPTPKYVALKILMAEASTEDCRELMCAEQLKSTMVAEETRPICAPLRQFGTDRPNGSHLCFVYPVLGPKVFSGLLGFSKDLDTALRGVCHEIAKAMALLHALGICHGGLEDLPEEKVLEVLGKPQTTAAVENTRQPHQLSTAPPYLVYPVSWRSVDKHYFSNTPCVTDFGEAFKCTDRWALGCTLFEIRAFSPFDDDDDSYLDAMVETLGIMPEPWWSTIWEGRAQVYVDEPDELGRAVLVREEEQRGKGANATYHPSAAQGAHSLQEKLTAGVWYMSDDAPEAAHRDIPPVEAKLFADLLGQLLRWKAEERVSAEKPLSHKWFQL